MKWPQKPCAENTGDFTEQEKKCSSLYHLSQENRTLQPPFSPSLNSHFHVSFVKSSRFGFTPPHKRFLYLVGTMQLGGGKCWPSPSVAYKAGQHTATKAACPPEHSSLCFRSVN